MVHEVSQGDAAHARSKAVAPHRVGEPSPLIFHLTSALSAYGHGLLASGRADAPNFPWSGDRQREAATLGPDLDKMQVTAEIAARLRATVEGLEIWQTHPYRRQVVEPPALWHEGCSRLLDYGAVPEARAGGAARVVLVVPSLINRAYVLDLEQDRSMLRWLAARGARPLLLDWGTPGRDEAEFDLHDYGERLSRALDFTRGVAGRAVAVMGYCMGGTLAAGLAARRPAGIERLVTIGAPWDFASTEGIAGGFRAMFRAQGTLRTETLLDNMGHAFGAVPVSLFQMLFALINPIQAALKFQKLARMDPASPAAAHFVALEDWLADGMPMTVRAAKDLLIGWQIRNQTARLRWQFLGGTVDPRAIDLPSIVLCGKSDSIAPRPIAEPLGRLIPGATVRLPSTGHVGMVVGSLARAEVWEPVADFLGV